MNWYTQARERYKNDPEYLEILKEKNRENCRKAYQKRKEKKKNGSAGNSADSDPVGGGGRMPHNNDGSDKELSKRTLGTEDGSSEGGYQTKGLQEGERQLGCIS